MRISLNTIKEYLKKPVDLQDDELIKLIGSRLVEVEEVIDLAPKYKGIYIVKVISAEKIPDTHLSLCQIDAGERTADFSNQETVQVVCGAPNVHAGMWAAWITPGAIVPSTYGNENFKLSVRKLRGYDSNGMLAAADELDLGTDHEGIIEIDPKGAVAGADLAAAFGLNDLILDVENKSLTHRPDCFGLIGFAREVAGILGMPFEEPPVFQDLGKVLGQQSNQVDLQVEITNPELCPRYSCAVFDLPKLERKYFTPEMAFLAKAGMRAIDPMVDLTNLLMLQTGQPLHAFDYDKLVAVGGAKSPKIIVRVAKAGEKLQLLDGKTIECIPEDILITSNDTPVALAGAMGGRNTEIDASTTKVILESATFSLYHLRKTQMAHGIFSEAITRFTKGQPAAITLPVLESALTSLKIAPLACVDAYPSPEKPKALSVPAQNVNRLLGADYEATEMVQTLSNVGFAVTVDQEILSVVAPLWRTDIHIQEDIIEEIGRLLGYDNIPLALPSHAMLEAQIDPMVKLKEELRNILSDRLALNEVLTYSFVSKNLIKKVGLEPEAHYEIINSISPELQCFRSQIAPSLLDKVRENLKSGHQGFTLYELNQVAFKSQGLTVEHTPIVDTHLGIVTLQDFYGLKAQFLALGRDLGIKIEYSLISAAASEEYPYLEPKRAVELTVDGRRIGTFGEVRWSVLRQFKLDAPVSALELDLQQIVDLPRQLAQEPQISKYPAVERDITLKVATDAPFGRFDRIIDDVLSAQKLIYCVTPLSIYQAAPESETKNISFRLKFSDPTKTLAAEEISAIIDKVTRELTLAGAEII